MLVPGGKKRLARNDVHIDAGLLVIEIFTCTGTLSTALLRDAILFRGEFRYDVDIPAIACQHVLLIRNG